LTYYLHGAASKKEFFAALRVMEGVAFDMESVGDEVIGLGVGDDTTQAYAVGEKSIVELMEHFEIIQGVRIAHAAKADLTALGVTRVPSFYPLFDTMIAAYLTPGFQEGQTYLSLKDLARSVLNVEIDSFSTLIARYKAKDLSGVPEEAVARYNISQIISTHLLWQSLRKTINITEKSKAVFDLEMAILPILGDMEEAGILTDKKRLVDLGKRFRDEGSALQDGVAELTSGHVRNVNSPKQVSDYIFGKEEGQLGMRAIYRSKRTNKPSTSERVLKKLLEKDPEKFHWVRILLRSRQIKKLAGTYCDGIVKRLDPQNRSHTQLSQVTAETGRLASKEPNHQNIPKRRIEGLEIRRCMIAPPGHVLIACDMDQLELRLIAEEAGESKMQEAFHAGEDIHMKTALQMFNDPTKRFPAKILNYTIVYLAGAQQIADQVGRSKAVAEMWQDKYFRTYSKLRKWIDEWAEICSKQGYVETWLGRRRDMTRYFNINYEEGRRKSVNTRIQGTAAEVLKLAMVRIDDRLRKEKMASRMLMQIHDEILLEAPLNEVDHAKEVLRQEMTTSYKGMPLPCTVKVGKNWADVK
jgi:DNA polymerase-1